MLSFQCLVFSCSCLSFRHRFKYSFWRVFHIVFFKEIYKNQLQALAPIPPPSRWSLADFVFTFIIRADGVPPVQWTGSLVDKDGQHADVELWTEATAPSWAYDGDFTDNEAKEAYVDSPPRLTLDVLVSRACTFGVQTVAICVSAEIDEWYSYDEDVHDGHDGPAAAFDSFVPARCDQADVLGAEKNEDSAPCVFFRPWFHVSRNRGYIREGTIFRDLRDYDEMSSEAVLSYLADVVPWDS